MKSIFGFKLIKEKEVNDLLSKQKELESKIEDLEFELSVFKEKKVAKKILEDTLRKFENEKYNPCKKSLILGTKVLIDSLYDLNYRNYIVKNFKGDIIVDVSQLPYTDEELEDFLKGTRLNFKKVFKQEK